MKRDRFSVLFFVKKSKPLRNGSYPLYVRITINGDSFESSLKRSIDLCQWDQRKQRQKGNTQAAISLNQYLADKEGKAFDIWRDHSGKQYKNLTAFKNAFLGKRNEGYGLIQLFSVHNSDFKRLVGKQYSKATYSKFKTSLKHLSAFIQDRFNSNDKALIEIDFDFIVSYEHFLKLELNCQHNSAMKHIKALRKIIRLAISKNLIKRDPFMDYSIKEEKVQREFLVKDELIRIIEKEIQIDRLDRIRDLFVFQCFTGLSFSDLKALTADNIQIGIDGKKWIHTQRTKNGNQVRLPLLDQAKAILDKYTHWTQTDDKLLPVPSNQKMNAYLKEIATITGIKKSLTTHCARHTFATTVTLESGVSIEAVSKMLGHTKLQTTQVYAKILDTRVSEEMSDLNNRLKNNSLSIFESKMNS